jgi:membrane protein YqaA with SNARE-associated domain
LSPAIHNWLEFFLRYGVFGIFLVAVADDSFLFLPIGSDLLTVILVARHHDQLLSCLIAGALGSTAGVFLLDLVCRKGGEAGLERLVKPGLLNYLKKRMERNGAMVIIVSCLAPPPFPFGAAIATASALQFPRQRLLTLVLLARAARYALVGWSAIAFGRRILRIAESPQFIWSVSAFIAFCLVGSILSVIHWIRIGRNR